MVRQSVGAILSAAMANQSSSNATVAEKPIPSRRGRRWAIAAIAVLIVLIGIELTARFVPWTPARWQSHQRFLELVSFEELERVLQPDPELFWKLRPNLHEVPVTGFLNEKHVSFRVSTDSRGARIPGDGEWSRREGRRVLFLGDSTAFGIGVDAREAYPENVQSLMEDISAVNAAAPNYSAYQGRRYLETVGLEYKPACVVAAFGIAGRNVLDSLGDLEAARWQRCRDSWRGLSGTTRLLLCDVPTELSSRGGGVYRRRLDEDELSSELDRIAAICRKADSPLIMISGALEWQMERGEVHTADQDLVRDAADRNQAIELDLFEELPRRGGKDLFVDVVHLNAQGHRAVAEALVPKLREALKP